MANYRISYQLYSARKFPPLEPQLEALAAIAWLLTGAFQRGRDSFFTAAGTSCGVVLLIEAFVDASLLKTTIVVIAASILGLALSQSVSRTLQ